MHQVQPRPLRLLDGRFMEIRQAMALPKGRPAAAAYVAGFVEEMKASGYIAEALRRHGIDGARVADAVADPVAPQAPTPPAR